MPNTESTSTLSSQSTFLNSIPNSNSTQSPVSTIPSSSPLKTSTGSTTSQKPVSHITTFSPASIEGTNIEVKPKANTRLEENELQDLTGFNDTFIPPGFTLPQVCHLAKRRIHDFLEEEQSANGRLWNVQQQVRGSLRIIGEALDRFGLPHLSLSYNGGKDCLVLLILYLSILAWKDIVPDPLKPSDEANTGNSPTSVSATTKLIPSPSPPSTAPLLTEQNNTPRAGTLTSISPKTPSSPPPPPQSLQSIYIQAPHPFPAVESFVSASATRYHLALARYPSPMKAGFAAYLAANHHIRAIFVGTRRTDPHGGQLRDFQRTDHGWPDFVRVHPVLEWGYGDVWAFLRHLEIPYCKLYDQGYTSLGGTRDTFPNPALKVTQRCGVNGEDGRGTVARAEVYEEHVKEDVEEEVMQENICYRPAYELEDGRLERLGRDR